MEYSEVLKNARERIGPNCRVCPECNGLGCANKMPGPGSKAPGNGAHVNFEAWKKIRLNMDTIAESSAVDTAADFLGRSFGLPVITAPVGSLKLMFNPTDDIRDFNEKCTAACESMGILHAYGDGLEEKVLDAAIASAKAHSMSAFPVLNPNTDEEIMSKMDMIKCDAPPPAICVVVDSAGLPHLRTLQGKAGTKTVEQLRALKEHAGTPFIVKGIMTAKAAAKAVEAGADAIIVSNHGGRVLPHTPATAEVLPEIVREVGGKVKIIVDGGIRTGIDIFKALALGADMVMICRPVLISYYGGGQEGIECYLNKLKAELSDTMYMCGARRISDICSEMIRF